MTLHKFISSYRGLTASELLMTLAIASGLAGLIGFVVVYFGIGLPTPELQVDGSSPLSGSVLVIGLLAAFLLALAIHLAQTAWLYGKRARSGNENLENAITGRKRTEELVQLHVERLRALHEIGQAITSSLEVGAVLDILIDKIGSLLPNLVTEVWLLNRESRQLEQIACGNLDKEEWMRRKLEKTPPLLKAVLEKNASVLVSNVQTDPRILDPKFFRKHGLVSYQGVPLVAKGKILGVITFMTREEHQFSKEESEFLSTLAGEAAIAIHNSQLYEETKKQAELLEQDIIRRKRVEIELKTLADQLKRSNDELQDFASVASHDLQEPLRKIRAFGDRLKIKCGESLNEEGGDYIDRMQHAAGRMQTLINDMLTFSRVTTKAKPFVPVDLAEVTREVLSDLEVRIMQTAGQVEVGDLPTIDADPLQMRQLMQNLVGNALKFHREEESPVVKIQSQLLNGQEGSPDSDSEVDELCQITVTDNGIGFDEKYLDRIFNLFQRLHGRSNFEGSGMGLAVCRKIAERHGGDITAKSKEGEGTTFIVKLPTKQTKGENEQWKNLQNQLHS